MTLEILTTDSHEYKFNALDFGSLHFSVQAPNDAKILLTYTNANKSPKYEITIGGWKNTKSAIIKNNEPECAIVQTPQILSNKEARGFWIKWGGGYIDVGKQGQVKPFMSWQDNNEIFNFAYFGVRTNWGATGVWIIEDNIYMNTINSDEYIFRVIMHGSMSFSVSCENDAHIALTTKSKESEPIIEVFLGILKNTASAICFNKELPDKVHILDTPQLLSKKIQNKFTVFWKNGLIEIFWDYTKLFEWIDPKPFSISHYGVRTCNGAVGNWWIFGTADEQFRSKVVPTKPLDVHGLCNNCNGTWLKANNGEVFAKVLSQHRTHKETVLTKQHEKEWNEQILDFFKMCIVNKCSDDHDVFGSYVAMELRNLKTSEAQKKLRTLMRDAISRVVKEESELPIKNSNSDNVNNKDQHNNSQTSHKTTVSNDFLHNQFSARFF